MALAYIAIRAFSNETVVVLGKNLIQRNAPFDLVPEELNNTVSGIKFLDTRRIPVCGGIQPILYHYMVGLSFVEQEESDLFCLMVMGYTYKPV